MSDIKLLKIDNTNKEDITKSYNILSSIFPKGEINPLDEFIEMIKKDSNYFLFLIEKDKKIVGSTLLYNHNTFMLGLYIGIKKEYRGRGIGSHLIKSIMSTITRFIIEVERPAEPYAIKRIKLYKSLGLKLYNINYYMPSLEKDKGPFPMFIMSNSNLDKKDLKECIESIYNVQYKEYMSYSLNKEIPSIEEQLKEIKVNI